MRIAYFDCFAGASGDMILGALLDAGLSVEVLNDKLSALGIPYGAIGSDKVTRKGIGGTRANVILEEKAQPHRHLKDIEDIINSSRLDPAVKEKSIRIFQKLAEAEAAVHRTSPDKIHFHEVGALDAVVDIVGAVIGITEFGIEEIYCSPIHVGSGTVTCAHGVLPVPAPATLELIRNIPVYSKGIDGELLTPTGAAILTTFAHGFGPMPEMTIQSIGYGAGKSDYDIPNLLRVVLGEKKMLAGCFEYDRIAVIETVIDDMNPQMYDYIFEKMSAINALDIYLTPVHMKKSRPGTLLTVLCTQDKIHDIAEFLMRETTSIGMRWRMEDRIKADREIITFDTPLGAARVKIARIGEDSVNFSPEYEDCKAIASETNTPLKTVMETVRSAAAKQLKR